MTLLERSQSAHEALKAFPHGLPDAFEAIKNLGTLTPLHKHIVRVVNENWFDKREDLSLIENPELNLIQSDSGLIIARSKPYKTHQAVDRPKTITSLVVMRSLIGSKENPTTPWIHYRFETGTASGDVNKEHQETLNTNLRKLLLEKGIPISLSEFKDKSTRFAIKDRESFDELNVNVFNSDGTMAGRIAGDNDFDKQGVVLQVQGQNRLYLGTINN